LTVPRTLQGDVHLRRLPTQDVILVHPDVSFLLVANQTIRTKGPDHDRFVRFETVLVGRNRAIKTIQPFVSSIRNLRDRTQLVESITALVVAVQVHGDNVWVPPRITINSIQSH